MIADLPITSKVYLSNRPYSASSDGVRSFASYCQTSFGPAMLEMRNPRDLEWYLIVQSKFCIYHTATSAATTRTFHPTEEIARRFRSLADEWYRDRPRGDLHRMCEHPAYQQVIDLGWDVVPYVIEELNRKPEHWFRALARITGAKNVVPEESRGKLPEMAAAWVTWWNSRQ